MPAAARVADTSTHGGAIVGPGIPNVFIGGMPAAVVGDQHVCVIPPNTGHITVSPFVAGSGSVFIGGMPALRTSDTCVCGAAAAVGMPTVMVGG
jgi:uncharacterized Zn-binding protein involved in type VI secretion